METNASHVWLAPTVSVDVNWIEQMAGQLDAGRWDGDAGWSLSALGRELLPDWTEDWVLLERERWRQVSLHALENLCRKFVTLQRFGAAIQAGLAAVSLEPLRESAQRALIEAHVAEGNRCEAIRQYRMYESLLKRELDLSPSPQLTLLVR